MLLIEACLGPFQASHSGLKMIESSKWNCRSHGLWHFLLYSPTYLQLNICTFYAFEQPACDGQTRNQCHTSVRCNQPGLELGAGLQALKTHEEHQYIQHNLTCVSALLLQVFILDSLAWYKPRDSKDAESIVERVTPRLQHANCAVVLSAVKVTSSADLEAHELQMTLVICLVCCQSARTRAAQIQCCPS